MNKIDTLLMVLRRLRAAKRRSDKYADKCADPRAGAALRNGWTKAALEKDRWYEVAREQTKQFFGLKD